MPDTNSNNRTISESHATGHSESAAEVNHDLPVITSWSHAKMVAMQEKIAATITELQTSGAAELRSQTKARAAEIGLSIEELLGLSAKKPRVSKSKTKRDQ